MSFDERLKKAQEDLTTLKNLKIKVETQLEENEKQKAVIVEEMKKYNLTPENIQAKIATLEQEIEVEITSIETSIKQIKDEIDKV